MNQLMKMIMNQVTNQSMKVMMNQVTNQLMKVMMNQIVIVSEISWDTDLDSNCSYFVKVLQNEINNYKPSARRSVYLGNAPQARRFHAAQAKKTSEDNRQMIYKKLFPRQINLLNIWNIIIDKD
nr:1047_t:CDS:1 [Entrophospora candida]